MLKLLVLVSVLGLTIAQLDYDGELDYGTRRKRQASDDELDYGTRRKRQIDIDFDYGLRRKRQASLGVNAGAGQGVVQGGATVGAQAGGQSDDSLSGLFSFPFDMAQGFVDTGLNAVQQGANMGIGLGRNMMGMGQQMIEPIKREFKNYQG